MFKNNVGDDADFCEAYKSQILNPDDTEEKESAFLPILTILFLLILIIALSIYGYNYFMSSSTDSSTLPPVSVQTIEDDDLKITIPKEKVTEKQVLEIAAEPIKAKIMDVDMNKMADDVKIAISRTEEKNISSKEEVSISDSQSTGKKESTYIEDLAKLNEEIEKKQSSYIEDLEKLTNEIDQERK